MLKNNGEPKEDYPEIEITGDSYFLQCPHCGGMIEVLSSQINCKIFRHSSLLSPHAHQSESESVDRRFGCGKPFYFDGLIIRKIGYM